MGSTIKRLAILGSTGSIGRQTLEVVRALPDRFQVIGLAAGQNIDLLTQQINEFKPGFVHHQNREAAAHHTGTEYEFLSPEEMSSHPEVDIVVIASSGESGLMPTLAAVKAGKTVALASKESLVMAGEIITNEAKRNDAQILPIDSEHSALWQCLRGEDKPAARLILTASGGPFRHYSPEQLSDVTVEQTLAHPSWQMGRKVTVDSATLMNKGLEIIEAHWLFDMPIDGIRVLIHPQSIVHSMVEFIDGSIKAQLSYPDMRMPIQYALSFPERLPNCQLPRLDWRNIESLNFAQPDFDTFLCLKIAIEAGKKGGTCPAVLCAADEIAVELFLSHRIKFGDISRLVSKILAEHETIAHPSLDQIMAAAIWARERVMQLVSGDNL